MKVIFSRLAQADQECGDHMSELNPLILIYPFSFPVANHCRKSS